MSTNKVVLFALSQGLRERLFAPDDLARIAAVGESAPASWPSQADKPFLLQHVPGAEIVVTGWGTAPLDADVVARAPQLRLMCHSAGTVKPLVSDALYAQARVTSAAAAIAPGVAEFCIGLMLLASKRVFWAAAITRQGGWSNGLDTFGAPFELYRQKIGVIGAGHVGRHLLRLLRQFECEALLYDPYCSAEAAAQMGARKVDTLDEIFAQCAVVSLNAPTTGETRGMLRGRHFALLRDGAVFINTARSAVIDEPEFVAELEKQRFIACIDVTDPEPAPADHPFRRLPNVILTPHMAGAVAQNLYRLGAFVADEIVAYANGQPLHYEVRYEDLARMA
jgi:phosphoglycerate dehydrogenase-like enzyme